MSAGMRDKRVGGMTVASHHAIVRGHWRDGVGGLTIADPLPRLAGHLVADQGALSKPMLHVTVGEDGRGRRC